MLIKGQYIREEPPQIGSSYVQLRSGDITPEEEFAQNLVTGWEDVGQFRPTDLITKVLLLFKRG
jgi:hypothetical protein